MKSLLEMWCKMRARKQGCGLEMWCEMCYTEPVKVRARNVGRCRSNFRGILCENRAKNEKRELCCVLCEMRARYDSWMRIEILDGYFEIRRKTVGYAFPQKKCLSVNQPIISVSTSNFRVPTCKFQLKKARRF